MIDVEQIKTWMVKAGQIALEYYNKPNIEYKFKENNTIVTEADFKIEQFIRKEIRNDYPDYAIIGEELDHESGNAYAWIIDPIDGTAPFFWNIPTWCISIALTQNHKPFMGFVYAPLTGDFYHTEGSQSFLNNHPISVSAATEVSSEGAFCISNRAFNKFSLQEFNGMVYSLGSGIFNNMLVARGSVIGALSISPSLWDLAAAAAMVKDAGGKMVYLDGTPLDLECLFTGKPVSKPILAGPPQLIKPLLEMIQFKADIT